MSFVCLAPQQEGVTPPVLSARPMSLCHQPFGLTGEPVPDPAFDPKLPRFKATFGLIANSGRGDIAAVDLQRSRLVDLDVANAGYGTLPVGQLPEVIRTTADGCQAVTLNYGSCDLTMVDTTRLLASQIDNGTPASATPTDPAAPDAGVQNPAHDLNRRIVVTRGSGAPLGVRAGELSFLPQPLRESAGTANVCRSEGAYGPSQEVVPWQALVTFPACDLVALVDLPSGRVRDSMYVRGGALVPAGAEPVCPAECLGATVPTTVTMATDEAPANADGGTTVDGGAGSVPPVPAGPYRISALALVPDGTRAYVGGTAAPFLMAVDVTPSGLSAPATGGRITLHEAPGGTTRLRLSVDPYRVDAAASAPGAITPNGAFLNQPTDAQVAAAEAAGVPLPPALQFIYAVALDGSVRVVDVAARAQNGERECEANLDPLQAGADPGQPCFAVPDDPALARAMRRPFALGPGIRLPVLARTPDAPSEPLVDVTFVSMRDPARPPDVAPEILDGDFALLLASSGQVFYVELETTARRSELFGTRFPKLKHNIRNQNVGPVNDNRGAHGAPRIIANPVVTFPEVTIPFTVRPFSLPLSQAPQAEGVLTRNVELQPEATGAVPVPAWAGFPRPSITPPQSWSFVWEDTVPQTVRSSGNLAASDGVSAGTLTDLGANFCDSGVRRGDVVQLLGCTLDLECGPKDTAVCVRPTTGERGICFNRPVPAGLAAGCDRLLNSRRRYEVLQATRNGLELGLLLDEIPRPSIAVCTTDADCRQPSVPGAPNGFFCRTVRAGEPARCVMPCEEGATMAACRPGFVCESVPGAATQFCAEAPPLDTACTREENAYRVQAGKSFLVTGGLSPRAPGFLWDAAGRCLARPVDPLLVDRIPLSAPACQDVPPGQANDQLLLQTEPPAMNPCLFSGPNAEVQDGVTHIKALFQNQDLRLVFTNLDSYVGDTASNTLNVEGGFIPTGVRPPSIDVAVAVPTRLLTSPMKIVNPNGASDTVAPLFRFVYMIDSGRLASGGNRGQVLRLNPRNAFFYSNSTKVPFLIQ